MKQQPKSTVLTGTPRDYPQAPDGFTPVQTAWWQSIQVLLRQQDAEIADLRAKINTPIPTQTPPAKPSS